jgi:UDP-N-acetylglucosamine 2-epimerase (non-hydrolysing)
MISRSAAGGTRPVIAYVVGARPNYVKMAPLIERLRLDGPDFEHVVIDTGQHYDHELSEIFVEELGLGPPQYRLGIGSGTHGEQTGRGLERIETVLAGLSPRALVVPGDVNSTLAAALAASKLGIPIAHLEAGLRSFDRSMPEEINRVLTDQLATWCFIHSPEAAKNLLREGVADDSIAFVGNTMIDTLVRMKDRISRSDVLRRNRLEPGIYLLVTLHRPALVDAASFGAVIDALGTLSEICPIVFPVHPRTRRGLAGRPHPTSLRLVDPVGYIDFLSLETNARGVVTDSGGVQEETTFLGVPCFTMRDNTERPVTIVQGTNHLIGTRPEALAEIPALLESAVAPHAAPEGWDGRAAERAAAVLLAALRAERVPAGEAVG